MILYRHLYNGFVDAVTRKLGLQMRIVQTAATTVRTHCNPKIDSAQETIRQPSVEKATSNKYKTKKKNNADSGVLAIVECKIPGWVVRSRDVRTAGDSRHGV